jgi:phosphoglycerate dehydrogenase-like enzyme
MKVVFGIPADLTKYVHRLAERFPGVEFSCFTEKRDILRALTDADVFMGWLDRETFLQAKKLKWIQSPSSGVNYFLAIPELVEGEVLLTSASGTHGVSVAESAMAMILAHTRGIAESCRYRRKRTWAGSQIRKRLVVLKGTTMGIIGCGAIGRALAQRARGFQMRVIAVDVACVPADGVDELWDLRRLDDLLRESDYVVVTVPYTKETADLISEREIGLMKDSAMLVVMSRGGIVDETALLTALREDRLAAAAMDVFETEPLPPESEFWDTENLIITPHVAGGTQFEIDTLMEIFTENLDKFLRGQRPLRNQVDKLRQY